MDTPGDRHLRQWCTVLPGVQGFGGVDTLGVGGGPGLGACMVSVSLREAVRLYRIEVVDSPVKRLGYWGRHPFVGAGLVHTYSSPKVGTLYH